MHSHLAYFNRVFVAAIAAIVLLSSGSANAATPASPTEADWTEAFGKFKAPHILFKNESALEARLRMLDYAPAGSDAIVLAFVFENGITTRTLAAHACKAVQRGVNVRWMMDSKWGARPGVADPFDHPITEEVYQYVANCGVQVRIHNYFDETRTLPGGKMVPGEKYLFPKGEAQMAQAGVNRLNHRKLFWVRTPAGQACFLLGGRNLGDHYLAWHGEGDSFIDSDIMICNHYKQDAKDLPYAKQSDFEKTVDQALASFEELWNDEENGANNDLEGGAPVRVLKYAVNKDFEFKHIYLEKAEGRVDAEFTYGKGLDSNAGKDEATGLVPVAVAKSKHVPRGRPFRNSYDWDIKTSIWNPEYDQVRAALHDMVRREQAEIYLESAYMDFDPKMMELLKDALERGVRVTVLSNSVFTSDAGSKVIPFTRGEFVNEMLAAYGDNFEQEFDHDYYANPRQNYQSPGKNGRFEFYVTSPYAGHMMHFKGAGFKCQKGDDGKFYKSFIIGSHNFHVRSGLADKEHALTWKEPVDLTCFNRHVAYFGKDELTAEVKAEAKAKFGMDYDEIVKRHFYYEDGPKAGTYGMLNGADRDLIEHRMRYWAITNGIYEGIVNKPILLAFPTLRSELDTLDDTDGDPSLIERAKGWIADRMYVDYKSDTKIAELKPGVKRVLSWLSPVRNFVSSFL